MTDGRGRGRMEESRSCGSHRRRDRGRQEDNGHRRNANFELSRRGRVHETEEGGGRTSLLECLERASEMTVPFVRYGSKLLHCFFLSYFSDVEGGRRQVTSHSILPLSVGDMIRRGERLSLNCWRVDGSASTRRRGKIAGALTNGRHTEGALNGETAARWFTDTSLR